MSIKAKFATSATTRATKEANARSGYSASGFFARASDIPAVVSKSLPDDQFCTIDDMLKALRAVERQLLQMSPHAGQHYVMLSVREARDLALTLVLADTSIGLKEMDPLPVIAADHKALKDTVHAVKKVITAAQDGSLSYEMLQDKWGKLPDPELANKVLNLLGQRAAVVQSLAGPIDIGVGKLAVKEVPSEREHELRCRVSGGFDEQNGTVVLEVDSLNNADPRLFSIGSRITVKVVNEEHRISLLLAQLAKANVHVRLKIPRIPITVNMSSRPPLRCDLEHVEALDQTEPFEEIKASICRQFNLDF